MKAKIHKNSPNSLKFAIIKLIKSPKKADLKGLKMAKIAIKNDNKKTHNDKILLK